MTFSNREDAGQKLGRFLAQQNLLADLVLGLPRGGVVVAAQVAKILQCPLSVVVVRKIGHPYNREFAVGALTEHGQALDPASIQGLDTAELDAIIAEERERLAQYAKKFQRADHSPLSAKKILIVDDGLATGATAEAAVNEARILGAAQVILAVPVASTNAVERLSRVADLVIALEVDPGFMAVGQYYRSFTQTTDEEVKRLLDL